MSHFTYADSPDRNTLKQGDILTKTDPLSRILRDVHPYFDLQGYNYFIVLTQSCDLIIRESETKCKSKYITISAIRPLEDALRRKAKDISKSKLEKIANHILDDKSKNSLTEFLSSLFNNNIPEYFYLHPDTSFNFLDPSVAILRVSIALKSDLHYEACLSSKILELTDNFQAKLGWLVGNLYSRVGTEDWVPNILNPQIKDHLKSNFTVIPNLKEIEASLFKTHEESEIQNMSTDELIAHIKKIKIPSKKEKILQRLQEIILKEEVLKTGYDMAKFINIIRNDSSFSELLK